MENVHACNKGHENTQHYMYRGRGSESEQRNQLIPYNPTYRVALHVPPCHLEPGGSMA